MNTQPLTHNQPTTPNPQHTTPAPPVAPLTAAKFYRACGYSLIPVLPDGTKKPAQPWDGYKTRSPRPDELEGWFTTGRLGIALIQGRVSGLGLCAELLEFETQEVHERWQRAMVHRGHADLADALDLRVLSPGGGVHLYYRHEDEPQGNQKLARGTSRIEGHNGDTLIETRGEGGYVLAPGSPASCHQSGKPYRLLSGSFRRVPTLTAAERQAVFAVCRELDERPKPAPKPRTERAIQVRTEEGGRPGDDFNERGALDALACLERHGWSVARDHGEWQELCRPGKRRGSSATFGYVAPGVLHVFSSNAAPFELDSTCGPFEIVTRLDFGGDFAACARFLGNRGYGSPLPPRALDRLHAKPAHRTMPGETGDEPMPQLKEEALLPLEDQVRQTRQMLRRMAALMRLAELGMAQWPCFRVADEQDAQSEADGETVIDVANLSMTERLVSLDSALLATMRNMPVSDAIRLYESELQSASQIDAYRMLWQIDHLFDCADVYLEHQDCLEYYLGHAESYVGPIAVL